jgi:hypothetical protein
MLYLNPDLNKRGSRYEGHAQTALARRHTKVLEHKLWFPSPRHALFIQMMHPLASD